MIDVSPKFHTLGCATAEGFLCGRPEVLRRVVEITLPKGDVTELARAAGINGKNIRGEYWCAFGVEDRDTEGGDQRPCSMPMTCCPGKL